ncbi:MAG: ABC transporter permease subunit [Alphaproteobacteria bacterium]|nr:ABC transporter permease subunit [Alphaproteobacteria bacterium]MBL6937223.1 ABC transporter permease subunit [Alphaproteobacteria bacterium]MBL7096215.1 ABC transporter permease subunit [Alphaproteobacteria bacterium]
MKFLPPISIEARRFIPSRWDLLAAILVFGFIALFADTSRALVAPLTTITGTPLSLDIGHLPEYALRTSLRMLIALAVSLVFTFTYATWAAKSQRAEVLLVPMLDILQSVPILGFISVTVVFFLSLAPGRIFGAELAAVFAIFTSQAWNMAFCFYQSLRTVPPELMEAGRMFGLNGWARFWRIEVPFGLPPLIWNMMMSMSGGWFFVVASEAISVGQTNIALPGIGSYIAVAIAQKNLTAIFYAIAAMLIVIVIYDQLLFRPLVAWADKFRFDNEDSEEYPESWVLDVLRRSTLMDVLAAPFQAFMAWTYRLTPPRRRSAGAAGASQQSSRRSDWVWYAALAAIVGFALWRIWLALGGTVGWADVGESFVLGLITMFRVLILIALASLIWTPIGVYVGLRPRLAHIVQPVAQFLAAFPANLLFPVAVYLIVRFALNADVWLSPLMVLGTQWYILFNVIAGASTLPRELRDAANNFQVKGWLWWRKVALPGVFPFYVTGAITASGGSWNAAIVAEVASWGTTTLHAHGLGAYIADATMAGDFHRIVLGIATMSFFVVIVNRLFWRPLYWYAERRYRLT